MDLWFREILRTDDFQGTAKKDVDGRNNEIMMGTVDPLS